QAIHAEEDLREQEQTRGSPVPQTTAGKHHHPTHVGRCRPSVQPTNANLDRAGLTRELRVGQRPDPPRRTSPRALPQRSRRAQMRLPRRDEPRPDWAGPPALDDALETRVERLRHDLRRPSLSRPQVNLNTVSYTVRLTDPGGDHAAGVGLCVVTNF